MTSPYRPATDLPRFVAELAEFVTLGEADLALVRETAPAVLRHEARFTEALYEHFLRVPVSAPFFEGEDGQPDAARLARRRHSLGQWLRESARAALTPGFAYSLLTVGLAHSHRPAGPGGPVPLHLMVGAMSLAQTALAGILREELGDGDLALAAAVAWNKLLLLQLAILTLGHVPPRPG